MQLAAIPSSNDPHKSYESRSCSRTTMYAAQARSQICTPDLLGKSVKTPLAILDANC